MPRTIDRTTLLAVEAAMRLNGLARFVDLPSAESCKGVDKEDLGTVEPPRRTSTVSTGRIINLSAEFRG